MTADFDLMGQVALIGGGIAALVAFIAGVLAIMDSQSAQRVWRKFAAPKLADRAEQRRLAASDEALAVKAPPRSNLPARSPFVGRRDKIEEIKAALARAPAAVAIVGMGGVGKSALAREICHELLAASPQTLCVWTSAALNTPRYEDVLDGLIAAFGLHFAYASTPANKAALIVDAARGIDTIFAFDSFENIAHIGDIRALINELAAVGRVLLTTRSLIDPADRQTAFAFDMSYIKLDPPSGAEAITFFRELNDTFGGDRSRKLTEAQIREIADAAGGGALAFRWVISQLNQGRSVESVLADLKSGAGGLYELMFSNLWPALSRDQHSIMYALIMFSAPPNANALSIVANVHNGAAVARSLVALSLIDPVSGGPLGEQLSMHPLTYSFVTKMLADDPRASARWRQRFIDYYVDYADRYGGDQWNWHKFDALEAEIANLWATFTHARDARHHKLVLMLRDKLTLFLSIRGHWSRRVELAKAAMEAAKLLKRERQYAWIIVYDYAYVELKRGNIDEAERLVREGLGIFTRKRDTLGIANAKRHLGRIAQSRGRFDEARLLYDESYALYTSKDSEYGAFLHWDLGDLARDINDLQTAGDHFEKAYTQSSGKIGKSEAINGMAAGAQGEIFALTGDEVKAEALFLVQLNTAKRIGRADELASANRRLARLLLKLGRRQEALGFARDGRAIYLQLGDAKAVGELDLLLATPGQTEAQGA